MEKLLLYKNKPELFKCQLNIDGADPEDTTIRLCLEFNDNKNLFFYGIIKEDGNCEIPIPVLKDINKSSGKATIEVIADSTYFKVYEADVELQNSVKVELLKTETTHNDRPSKPQVKINTDIKLEQLNNKNKKETITESKEEESITADFIKQKVLESQQKKSNRLLKPYEQWAATNRPRS